MDDSSNDLVFEALVTSDNERPTIAAPMPQDVTHGVEKFSATDLHTLRAKLLQSGVDSFQAAEIVASFLTGRGYGCSTHEARSIASRIEIQGSTPERIQAELESLARVM